MNLFNPAASPSTYGPDFDQELDGQRIQTQLEVIAALMTYAHQVGAWLTLVEISQETGYPESSVSAQLRHLRKPRFGEHRVEKRRRPHKDGSTGGTFEYKVYPRSE